VRIFAVINIAKAKKGPRSLAKVRKLLRIKVPNLSKVDLGTDEQKSTIIGMKNRNPPGGRERTPQTKVHEVPPGNRNEQ